jgi:hypothetical protein
VVDGDGSPLRASKPRQLDVEKNTVFYAVQRLADSAEIESVGKKWFVGDPLHEEWIRRLHIPPV